jgi:hypothetical protein
MHTLITTKQQKPSLYNKYTDWDAFRDILDERIDMKIPLKSTINTEQAVATPPLRLQHMTDSCPPYIKQKLTDKRKARRRWQITRAPEAKQSHNKLAKELKHVLHTHKNTGIQQYLENLSPHKDKLFLVENDSQIETTPTSYTAIKTTKQHLGPNR